MQLSEAEGVGRFGPYQVLERLGGGGTGVVYRARHTGSGRTVALKTVRTPDPRNLRSIRREIHALGRIRHPGIVEVVAQGVDAGLPWYAMPLLEGPMLRSHMEAMWGSAQPSGTAAAGDLPRAVSILRRLCDALAFLHGEGLVHRDLKPDNILLRSGDEPVLVDFGFASVFEGQKGRESIDAAGVFEGSFGYMAPEQIAGDLVDARADLYALGCILYEMLAGRPVFQGVGWQAVRHHLGSAPEPPSRWVDGVPPALDELVLRLLAKQPRERVGYAEDVAAVLERVEGKPAEAKTRAPRVYLYRPELSGRGPLLDELDGLLVEAKLGRGHVVLIGAESGAGKTRLAMEGATAANRRGFRVVTGECLPVDARSNREGAVVDAPLHPFKPLLQALADARRSGAIRAKGAEIDAAAAVLAVYEPSLSAPSAEPAALPPQEARRRVIDAMLQAVVALAAGDPLLIVLDDLQWADDLTIEALIALTRGTVAQQRVVVVGTYRTGEEQDALRRLSQSAGVVDRHLGRLDEAAVASIIGDMLAITSPPPALVRYLAEQSSGNPFFIAEYLRTAAGEGLLSRDGQGRWQVKVREEALQQLQRLLPFPSSLRDLLGRWLDHLSPEAKRLVEMAAVLGRDFDAELLTERVADEAPFFAMLEDLRVRNVIEVTSHGRMRFSHDKLREIAYEGVPPERRLMLHRSAAERIEARMGADPSQLGALAHHFMMAEIDHKSFEYLERAGMHALRVGACRAAADLFLRALRLAEQRGRAADEWVDAERRAAWRSYLGEARFGLGDIEGARDEMERALAALHMPSPGAERGRAALLLREIATQASHLARPASAPEPDARERARRFVGARAASRLCECYYYQQNLAAVTAAAILAVNLAERAGRRGDVRRQYAQLGYMAGLMRLHPLARRYFSQSREGGRHADDPSGAGVALYYEASYEATFCRWERASQLADEAIARLEGIGDQHELQIARTMRAHVHYYTGNFDATLPLFAMVRAAAKERDNVQLDAWGAYATARSLLPLGRTSEAATMLEEALRLLEGQADRSSHIITNGLLAEAYLHLGEADRAERAADVVLALAADGKPAALTEGRGYEATADVYLALWERAKGRSDREHLLAEKARRACSRLRQFGRMFPLSYPATLRCDGLLAVLSGRRRRGRALLERALGAAQALRMPYDEARHHAELGHRSNPGTPQRAEHLEAARKGMSVLGCAHHLRALSELR